MKEAQGTQKSQFPSTKLVIFLFLTISHHWYIY